VSSDAACPAVATALTCKALCHTTCMPVLCMSQEP
jgi:hypothetical protein